jgi:hypothetical protein
LFPTPVVHADLAALAAFAVADEQRTAAYIEVALGKVERFGNPKSGAPEHDDQAAQAVAVDARTGVAHRGNVLLDSRRIGWVAQTLVARWTPGVIARKRRRGASPAGDVDQGCGGHGSSDHRLRTLRMASITRATRKPHDGPRTTDRRGSLNAWIPSLSPRRAPTALRCATRLRRACWSQQQTPCAKSCAVIARRSSASAADADMPDLWRPALADFVQAAAVILDIDPTGSNDSPACGSPNQRCERRSQALAIRTPVPGSRSGQPC